MPGPSFVARVRGFSLTLVACLAAGSASAAKVSNVSLDGTDLKLHLTDGTTLSGPSLTGAILTVADGRGAMLRVRIDGAQRDPVGNSKRWLYDLRAQGASGRWKQFCGEGPDGLQLGFPVAGRMTADGSFEPSEETLTISCTGGAVAKCIRFGYAPWETAGDGTPLLDHFRACIRMVRADYCGNGQPHTRDGTLINIYDRLHIQVSEPSDDLHFEAAWGPDGAVCVRKTRLNDVWSLDQLRESCGEKLDHRIGGDCSEATAVALPGALILNDSGFAD